MIKVVKVQWLHSLCNISDNNKPASGAVMWGRGSDGRGGAVNTTASVPCDWAVMQKLLAKFHKSKHGTDRQTDGPTDQSTNQRTDTVRVA